MADRYIDTTLGTIYLKKIFASAGVAVDNLDITPDELDFCETWAENQIDSLLGMPFPTFPATPLLIRDICLILTASKVRELVITANVPNKDSHTDTLRKSGMKEIDDILHGRRAIIMPDGTFHSTYSGYSGGAKFVEQGESQLRRFFINMERDFIEMRQNVEEDGIEGEYNDSYAWSA